MNITSAVLKAPNPDTILDWPGRRINTFLTIRGAIILAFLAFLFYSPVQKETDIIAAVIVYVLSAYILILISVTLFYSRRLKGSIEITAFQPESLNYPGMAVSNIPALLLMKLNDIYVPPGYYLEIQVEFFDYSLKPSKHIITGRIKDKHFLREYLTFPHRGYWKISRINFQFSDKLNLTAYSWSLSDQIGTSDLLVNPPVAKETSLPVISSSNRMGDTLPDLNEKNGDPYDLKPYHPSDGLKKILWKVYAKSGELISRHPEASMTPEGQVLIFACAGKNDEEVCSSVLAYLRLIESLNLEILFTCYGGAGEEIAHSMAQAKELLIDTVWKSEHSSVSAPILDIDSLIDYFKAKSTDSRIDRIVVFCSKRRLSTQAGYTSLIELGESLQSRNIRPFFCIIDSFSINIPKAPSNLWARLFLNNNTVKSEIDSGLYYNFLSICKSKTWEFEEETLE